MRKIRRPLRLLFPSLPSLVGVALTATVVRLLDNAFGPQADLWMPWLRPLIDTLEMPSGLDAFAMANQAVWPSYNFIPPRLGVESQGMNARQLMLDLLVGLVIGHLIHLSTHRDRYELHVRENKRKGDLRGDRDGSSRGHGQDSHSHVVNVNVSYNGENRQSTTIVQGGRERTSRC